MEFNKIKSKKILNKSKNCFFKTPNIQVWEGNKHGQKKTKGHATPPATIGQHAYPLFFLTWLKRAS
jgi:hypothetical protein